MKKIIAFIFTLSIYISCFGQFNGLVINEFMASNTATITDEEGKFEDWIEIHNTTDAPISMLGLFLTDNPINIRKWECPDVAVPANGYLIIWADEDGVDGPLHANFKLSALGESIHLATADSTIIDEISFGEQTSDIATGRIPNGTGPFVEVSPTPNAINSLTSIFGVKENLKITTFPNPADEFVVFRMDPNEQMQISLMDLNGRLIKKQTHNKGTEGKFDTKDIPNGFYILSFQTGAAVGSKKILIEHN